MKPSLCIILDSNSNLHSKWHQDSKDEAPEAYKQYIEDHPQAGTRGAANKDDMMNTNWNKLRFLNLMKRNLSFHSFIPFSYALHFIALCIIFPVFLTLSGCASTEETTRIKGNLGSMFNELNEFKSETNVKLLNISKEQDNIRKQLVNISASVEGREDQIRSIRGKLDELEHQLGIYWKDTKAEISSLKTGNAKATAETDQQTQTPVAKEIDPKYESTYKEAFDKFQQGSYENAAIKFSDFINAYTGTPLVSNAYYWLGESYMNLKNYEKAIVNFQEVIDKYPKSDKASRALLSQAEAFNGIKDGKSSKTILKKVIELYPKTEEAAIAERKLRNLSLR